MKDNSMVVSSPRKLLPRSPGKPRNEANADQSLVLNNSSRYDVDEVDGIRSKASFGLLDITCIIVSIFSYVAVSYVV